MTDSIVVFTAVPRQEIIANRGSGDWVLNPDRGSQCKYLVCCRKPHWTNAEEGVPKKGAFLVGLIKRLIPGAKNGRGQQRYFVEIDQVAAVSTRPVWGNWRNPVRYDDIKTLGLDPRALKFKPVASAVEKSAGGTPVPSPHPRSLTIAEAKKALAATFGVRPEDIEINIRG
jgi:hypothetical protein